MDCINCYSNISQDEPYMKCTCNALICKECYMHDHQCPQCGCTLSKNNIVKQAPKAKEPIQQGENQQPQDLQGNNPQKGIPANNLNQNPKAAPKACDTFKFDKQENQPAGAHSMQGSKNDATAKIKSQNAVKIGEVNPYIPGQSVNAVPQRFIPDQPKPEKYPLMCPRDRIHKPNEFYNFFICKKCINNKCNCTKCLQSMHTDECETSIELNLEALKDFYKKVKKMREDLKTIQSNFDLQADIITTTSISFLDSILTKHKKVLAKKKISFSAEIDSEINNKKNKINELIDNLKTASKNHDKEVVKGMNETMNFVETSKQKLKDIVSKKLVYKPQLEEKLGLVEIIPKTFRKIFVIKFDEERNNIERTFFMFNEQYKLIISYLPQNKKYSAFIEKMPSEDDVPKAPKKDDMTLCRAEPKNIPDDFLMFNFTFILRREGLKQSVSDQCRKDAASFGVKYYILEDKIQKDTPYQFKIKVRYANYYSKCDAEKYDYLKLNSNHMPFQKHPIEGPDGLVNNPQAKSSNSNAGIPNKK